MKTDLSFLPILKQRELRDISFLLRSICDDIEMIILYGSYARNQYKESKDLAPNRWSGSVSDYDLLVITGSKETALNRPLNAQMNRLCLEQEFSAPVQISLFDIQRLNILLAEGQYFYTDIKQDAIELFNRNNYELAEKRELTLIEQKRIAEDHLEQWYERATSFLRQAHHAINDADEKTALFDLHQVTEACYKCILLVFSNRSPDEHYLSILEQRAAEYVPAVISVFPRETFDESNRFDLMDKAYIGARYIRDFYVEKEDIAYLTPLVEKLLNVTKEACEKRVGEITD